jgi:hypothetical protein
MTDNKLYTPRPGLSDVPVDLSAFIMSLPGIVGQELMKRVTRTMELSYDAGAEAREGSLRTPTAPLLQRIYAHIDNRKAMLMGSPALIAELISLRGEIEFLARGEASQPAPPKWERQESCPECDGDGCNMCEPEREAQPAPPHSVPSVSNHPYSDQRCGFCGGAVQDGKCSSCGDKKLYTLTEAQIGNLARRLWAASDNLPEIKIRAIIMGEAREVQPAPQPTPTWGELGLADKNNNIAAEAPQPTPPKKERI